MICEIFVFYLFSNRVKKNKLLYKLSFHSVSKIDVRVSSIKKTIYNKKDAKS